MERFELCTEHKLIHIFKMNIFFCSPKAVLKVINSKMLFVVLHCSQLNVGFGVHKLVKLDSDGAMEVKARFELIWIDPKWSWNLTMTCGLKMPSRIIMPYSDLWHPRFHLINCESDNCKR